MVFRRGGPAPQALTRGRPGSRRCGAVVAADRQRPTEFLRVFGELEPEPIEVVVEATYGRGLVRGPAGRCRHPRAYGPSAGHQGDLGRPGHQRRRRGQDLAQLLRTNLLAEAWIAPPTPVRPAAWSTPAPAWSACGHGCKLSCLRCWPTWASSPS